MKERVESSNMVDKVDNADIERHDVEYTLWDNEDEEPFVALDVEGTPEEAARLVVESATILFNVPREAVTILRVDNKDFKVGKTCK